MSYDEPSWVILPGTKLPPGAEALNLLGRVVASPGDPTGWYSPDILDAALAASMVPVVVEDSLKTLMSQHVSKSLRVRLSQIFNLESVRGEEIDKALRTKSVVTRFLTQYHVKFKALRDAHRAEIAEMLDKMPKLDRTIYFVVGVKTCLDAEIEDAVMMERNFAGDVELPVAEIVLAATGIPLPNVVNPGVQKSREIFRKALTRQTSKGERLFALQYCRVKYRREWFQKRDIEVKELYKINYSQSLAGIRQCQPNLYYARRASKDEKESLTSGKSSAHPPNMLKRRRRHEQAQALKEKEKDYTAQPVSASHADLPQWTADFDSSDIMEGFDMESFLEDKSGIPTELTKTSESCWERRPRPPKAPELEDKTDSHAAESTPAMNVIHQENSEKSAYWQLPPSNAPFRPPLDHPPPQGSSVLPMPSINRLNLPPSVNSSAAMPLNFSRPWIYSSHSASSTNPWPSRTLPPPLFGPARTAHPPYQQQEQRLPMNSVSSFSASSLINPPSQPQTLSQAQDRSGVLNSRAPMTVYLSARSMPEATTFSLNLEQDTTMREYGPVFHRFASNEGDFNAKPTAPGIPVVQYSPSRSRSRERTPKRQAQDSSREWAGNVIVQMSTGLEGLAGSQGDALMPNLAEPDMRVAPVAFGYARPDGPPGESSPLKVVSAAAKLNSSAYRSAYRRPVPPPPWLVQNSEVEELESSSIASSRGISSVETYYCEDTEGLMPFFDIDSNGPVFLNPQPIYHDYGPIAPTDPPIDNGGHRPASAIIPAEPSNEEEDQDVIELDGWISEDTFLGEALLCEFPGSSQAEMH